MESSVPCELIDRRVVCAALCVWQALTADASGYTLGLRCAWLSEKRVVRAITVEAANSRISHIQRVRSQGPLYIHTVLTEGHTYLGQPLGSSAVLGGGFTAGVEQIAGRRSYSAGYPAFIAYRFAERTTAGVDLTDG